MSFLLALMNVVFSSLERQELRRREAYLADSTDLFELERRVRSMHG